MPQQAKNTPALQPITISLKHSRIATSHGQEQTASPHEMLHSVDKQQMTVTTWV